MTDLELQSQETEALLKTSERPKKRALAIQLVALCGAAALAGAALASRAGGSRDVVVTGLARADGVVCPQTWEPVCGKDRKTYSNACMAGAMTFTTGACDEAPPATANETLSTNETLPVDVPDRKFTTTDDLDDFGGCGCSVQTCCDTLAAGKMYLGCQAIFDGTADRGGEICNQVKSGIIDGNMSVCDVPEIANGPAQLTGTFVDESCENLFNSGDTCIPVRKNPYFWLNMAFPSDSCSTFTFPKEGLTISVLGRCDGEAGLPFNIAEGGELGNSTTSMTSTTSENDNCPPPFNPAGYGPTGLIEYNDNTPGSVGLCQPLSNGKSVIFTVNGKWPCEAPSAPPTPAPTPHHHHHDGAVAESRNAALGSIVVAALTAAVLI